MTEGTSTKTLAQHARGPWYHIRMLIDKIQHVQMNSMRGTLQHSELEAKRATYLHQARTDHTQAPFQAYRAHLHVPQELTPEHRLHELRRTAFESHKTCVAPIKALHYHE